MKYLVVARWEEFQHYKNRAPLWIKNYTRLLHDDTYLGLTGHQRSVLHGIWLVYASSSCHLHFDAKSLSRRLQLRVTMADLKALKKAGFISVSASKPLADGYQPATPEKEIDREKEKEKAFAVEPAGEVINERVMKLLRVCRDADEGTPAVLRRLLDGAPEADLAWAIECATGPGVKSPTAVAVAELKKRAEGRAA